MLISTPIVPEGRFKAGIIFSPGALVFRIILSMIVGNFHSDTPGLPLLVPELLLKGSQKVLFDILYTLIRLILGRP